MRDQFTLVHALANYALMWKAMPLFARLNSKKKQGQ